MLDIMQWAERWGLPLQAIEELAAQSVMAPADDGYSEGGVQSRVRLEAAALGIYLWRNNVGAGSIDGGRHIRWGLANDSVRVNRAIKSGDLIGIRRRLVTLDMLGTYIGQFYSRECKASDWRPNGDERDIAQITWMNLINSQGGDAKIVTGPGSFT